MKQRKEVMRIPVRLALAVLFAAAVAQPATSLTIDSFEVGNFSFTDDATTVNATFNEQSGLAGTDVIGGVRLVRILASAAPLGTATAAGVLNTLPAVDDGAALSVVAVPSGSALFEFIYDGIADGNANSTSGALNLNLSAFSSIDVALTAPVVTGIVTVTLSASGPNAIDSETLAIANGVISFPLTNFAVNLASIKEIKVLIGGIDPGEAPIITAIAAVPEPGPGLLVAVGLVGLALRRRRAR
jgi:hypothetical protein